MGEISLGDKRALSSTYKHITDGTCLQLGFNILYPRMLLERPRDKIFFHICHWARVQILFGSNQKNNNCDGW